MNILLILALLSLLISIVYEYYKLNKKYSQIRIVGKGLSIKIKVEGDEAELKRLLAFGCYENKSLEDALFQVIENCRHYNRTGEDYVYEYNFEKKVKIDLYSLHSNPVDIKFVIQGEVDDLTKLLGIAASEGSDENNRSTLADACINLALYVENEMKKDFYQKCVFEPSDNPILCKICKRHKTQHWK